MARAPVTAEDLAALETDVLAGFVLARAAAGLSDATIASDVLHLEQVRTWFGRPLWDMEPPDADAYFGKVLRDTAKGTRLSRAQALKTYFLFLELRHKVEIHQMTGRIVECPIDEMNRPRGRQQAKLRIPPYRRPGGPAVRRLARRAGDLPEVRPGRPQLRRLPALVGGRAAGSMRPASSICPMSNGSWAGFGKLHVRHGKGARGSGPRERMVPLISNAGQTLRWFVEDVWGQFGDDHTRPGVALLLSERKNADGTASRVGAETLRSALAKSAERTFRTGLTWSLPTSFAISAPASSIWAAWILIAIQATLGMPGSPRPCSTCMSPEPISRTAGSQVSSVPSPV